jgi:hypothetical protein
MSTTFMKLLSQHQDLSYLCSAVLQFPVYLYLQGTQVMKAEWALLIALMCKSGCRAQIVMYANVVLHLGLRWPRHTNGCKTVGQTVLF